MARKGIFHQLRMVLLIAVGGVFLLWLGMAGAVPSRSASSASLWRSGGPYEPDHTPITPTVVHDVEASVNYAADHTLFAATRAGIFRSTGGGAAWEIVLPLPAGGATHFSHVRLSSTFGVDGIVVAAAANSATNTGALYHSIDGGDTWLPLTTFTETVRALVLSPDFATDHSLFVVTGAGNEVRKSTDGGLTWQAYRFVAEDEYNASNLAISPDYANDHTLFATGFGPVRQSTDGGVTWSPLDTYGVTYGLALSPVFATDRSVWASYRFIESPGDGTPENSVMRSFDGGASWLPTASGLPGVYEPFVRVLGVSPGYATDTTLFAGLSGQLLAAPYHALMRSYDRGASWVDLGPPPGDPDILDIAVTATAAEGVVAHVATTQGVWHYHAPCEQRVVNAGFEYDSGWHFPVTARAAGYSTENKHTGTRSARAGIRTVDANVFAYSSMQQTVTIPSDAISVTLTFWWSPYSGEGDLPPDVIPTDSEVQAAADEVPPAVALTGDRQYMLLLNEQGSVVERLLWTRRDSQQWEMLSFDLTKHAGKTLRLSFGVVNDGAGGVTSMFVDDVALLVCRTAAPDAGRNYLPLIHNDAIPTPEPVPSPTPPPDGPLWPEPPGAIELFAPVAGERYRSPFEVIGYARTFEGNVYFRLLDPDGNSLGQHRARAGMSAYDFFRGYLRFEVTKEMTATLEVYEAAAADQPPISSVQVPIVLEPGQRLIDLNAPELGSTVCGRVPVQGYSNTFEANVVVELSARDGSLLEQTTAMGGNLGIYAEFATYFDFVVTSPRAALIGAQEISPRDGMAVDHVRVPVSLYPAGHSACP